MPAVPQQRASPSFPRWHSSCARVSSRFLGKCSARRGKETLPEQRRSQPTCPFLLPIGECVSPSVARAPASPFRHRWLLFPPSQSLLFWCTLYEVFFCCCCRCLRVCVCFLFRRCTRSIRAGRSHYGALTLAFSRARSWSSPASFLSSVCFLVGRWRRASGAAPRRLCCPRSVPCSLAVGQCVGRSLGSTFLERHARAGSRSGVSRFLPRATKERASRAPSCHVRR